MATGFVFDDRFLLHRAPYDHPEHPGRLTAILAGVERGGLLSAGQRVPARPASDDELAAVHTRELIRQIDATAGRDFTQIDPDTYACRDSSAAARLAAGGLIDLTRRVAQGSLDNGFAMLRPPGHHAESGRAMGFCLYNNVAVAARAALDAGTRRIAIVDWDLHHGNGTQEIFWDEERILYFSTHQSPLYPGTGQLDDTGSTGSRDHIVNLPWPPGMGDAEYIAAFDDLLLPVAREFDPDLVLVSCGFDAALGDLLGQMRVTPEGYAAMTARLLGLARGRVVLALEGGYNLDAIGRSAAACARVLLGEPASTATPAAPAATARRLIDRARQIHRGRFPSAFPSEETEA